MFKIISTKIKAMKEVLNNEKGSLDIFATKLGLAVVTVIVIVLMIAAAQTAFPDLWDWFIDGMQDRFAF